ncbi:hypothetical protein LY76DRAFT_635031 [Colletotrichum caudatum]|nr:hypothetical protein LY76DRAFT_635031 [Colletotrichum caudatum]
MSIFTGVAAHAEGATAAINDQQRPRILPRRKPVKRPIQRLPSSSSDDKSSVQESVANEALNDVTNREESKPSASLEPVPDADDKLQDIIQAAEAELLQSIKKEHSIQLQSVRDKATLPPQAFQTDNGKTEEPPRMTGNGSKKGKQPAGDGSEQKAGEEGTGRKGTGQKRKAQEDAYVIAADDDDGDDLDDQVQLAEAQLALRQAEMRLTILRQRKKRKPSKH